MYTDNFNHLAGGWSWGVALLAAVFLFFAFLVLAFWLAVGLSAYFYHYYKWKKAGPSGDLSIKKPDFWKYIKLFK